MGTEEQIKKDAKEKIDLVESDDEFDKILGGLTKTRDDPRIGPSYWKNGQTFGYAYIEMTESEMEKVRKGDLVVISKPKDGLSSENLRELIKSLEQKKRRHHP